MNGTTKKYQTIHFVSCPTLNSAAVSCPKRTMLYQLAILDLLWKAALQVDTASAAMGGCNFPVYGCKGEDVLQDSCCHVALLEIGVVCSKW